MGKRAEARKAKKAAKQKSGFSKKSPGFSGWGHIGKGGFFRTTKSGFLIGGKSESRSETSTGRTYTGAKKPSGGYRRGTGS